MVTVKPIPNRTELPSYILNAANANFSTPEGTNTIFDYYYRSGKLPPGIKSKEDLLLAAQAVIDKSGKRFTSKQLEANAFGVNYQGPPLSVDKETGRVKINTRKYMSADGGLPPPVYDYIRKTYGVKTADLYTKAVRQEWKLMNLENQQLQSETGIAFDRGHWLANKFGGAESKRAGNNEIADLNRFRGADPRGDIKEVSKTSRASYGWLSDFHEWDLVNNNLNVTGSQYLTEADLQAISNGANESDRATIRDRLISQRIQEFERDGKPRSDRIGALFGSQLDRDETIKQQLDQLSELKDRRILEDGYDFSRGGMANERDIEAAQTRQAARLTKHQSLLQKGVTQGTALSPHTTNPSGSITNAQVLPPSSLTFDSNGNPVNPKPHILAIQKKGQPPTVTAPNLDTPRIGRTPYTGVVPRAPERIPTKPPAIRVGRTPRRLPGLGTAGAIAGFGLYMAGGASPAEAAALTTLDNTIGIIESGNTADSTHASNALPTQERRRAESKDKSNQFWDLVMGAITGNQRPVRPNVNQRTTQATLSRLPIPVVANPNSRLKPNLSGRGASITTTKPAVRDPRGGVPDASKRPNTRPR